MYNYNNLQMTRYFKWKTLNSAPKKLKLINEFNKVPGYKIYTEKSVTFLYTNNELSERESKKQSRLKLHQGLPW